MVSEQRKKYMREFMRKKRAKERSEIAEGENAFGWDWQAEAEEKLREEASKPKPKKKFTFDQRLAIVEKGMRDLYPNPDEEQSSKFPDYLQGANAFHPPEGDNPQPKPKTAQDKLKELFGDNA